MYRAGAINVVLVVFKLLFLWSTLIFLLEIKISFRILWIIILWTFYNFFSFTNNRKRCLTVRSQDYLPIGSQKNKFIFRSQNLLIYFKNFLKIKFREFPEFWGNFRKFILQNKEFSPQTKVHQLNFLRFCHSEKLCMLKANISINIIKFRVLRKLKLLYSLKFIWQIFFLFGIA